MGYTALSINDDDETVTSAAALSRRKLTWRDSAKLANPEVTDALLDRRASSSSSSALKLKAFDSGLKDMMHPPEKTYRGGEGVVRIVTARDGSGKQGGDQKYWSTTLFSLTGRALPWTQWLLYILYTSTIVLPVVTMVPGYGNISLLKALQLPINVLGTALFLLMSFRTNNCYDRWWEGRKLWGSMTTRCLNMSRLAQAWMASDSPHSAAELLRLTIAFTVVFKKWLRRDMQDLAELEVLMPPEDLEALAACSHPVLELTKRMTRALKQGSTKLPAPILASFDRQIEGMITDAAGCQRIVTTPMPFAYIVHLRSFMVVWLLALPVVFLPTMGCLTVPVCAVVAYQLLGFEDIGVEIEQPFGTDYNDLPVDLMSGQLFNELVQCLGSIQDDIQLAEAGAELGAASQD